MRDILQKLISAIENNIPCSFCSIAETRGSTPQKAGASMIVYPDGTQAGTLGGGCVEAEVKRQALKSIESTIPQLLTYNLDDNYGWDDGLICGGRMSVLTQPLQLNHDEDAINQAIHKYFHTFSQYIEQGFGCIEAVLIHRIQDAPVGARFLYNNESQLIASLHADQPPAAVTDNLPALHPRPRPQARKGIAYLPILPRIRLIIIGGGHVGQAVGELAADADFDVWVVDDRQAYANHDRLPKAQRCIVGEIDQVLPELAEKHINPSTYCLIVTRGHNHDEEALYYMANTPANYVGLIGSKRKIRLIFEDLLAKGISQEVLDRVYAPVGFDIGSQTVPEIAISIVAQLIAHRNLGEAPRFNRDSRLVE